MPVVALLPVWAFVYAQGMKTPEVQDEQLAIGEEVYGSCAGCHGANGEGGTGAQLNDGAVLATYPDPVAMMEWIHLGAADWAEGATSGPYGDPEREGGARDLADHSAEMPGFPDLTAEELAGVTRYIREVISGAPPATPELQELYNEWAETAIENAEAGELVYRNAEADPERVTAAGGEG